MNGLPEVIICSKSQVEEMEQKLLKFFQDQFEHVATVKLILDYPSEMQKALKKLSMFNEKKLQYEKIASSTNTRPTVRKGFTLVDAIEFYSEQCKWMEQIIETCLKNNQIASSGHAYVSFTNVLAASKALHSYKKDDFKIGTCNSESIKGTDIDPMKFQFWRAESESDVIWEHVGYPTLWRVVRLVVSIIVSSIVVIAVFLIVILYSSLGGPVIFEYASILLSNQF